MVQTPKEIPRETVAALPLLRWCLWESAETLSQTELYTVVSLRAAAEVLVVRRPTLSSAQSRSYDLVGRGTEA